MKDTAEVIVSMFALKRATAAQLVALQENVLADGRWDSCDGVRVTWEHGTMFCEPFEWNGSAKNVMILLGIEPDGYTHS